MKEQTIYIEQTIETTVRTGEQHNYYRVEVGEGIQTSVWVNDFTDFPTVEDVVKHCIEQLDENDSYYMQKQLRKLQSVIYQGEAYSTLGFNLE